MKNDNLIIENAKIRFRNFTGAETKFNRAGDRNFCVLIDPDDVDRLREDGWNIRERRPKEDDGDIFYYLQVAISFKNVPPKCFIITHKGKTPLDEDTIGSLDYADLRNIDISIRPYHWEVNGKEGVKAYLKTLYATIEEDEFADKYDEQFVRDYD